MLQCAMTSSHLDDFSDIVTYCNDNNIFFGGGGGLGILWEASTPQIPWIEPWIIRGIEW